MKQVQGKLDKLLYIGSGVIGVCQFYIWQLSAPINPFTFMGCFAVLVLCYKQLLYKLPTKRERLICGCFSVLLSLVITEGNNVVFNNDIFGSYRDNYIQPLVVTDLLECVCYVPQIFLLIYNLYLLTKKFSFEISTPELTTKKRIGIWFGCSAFIMACWLPYLFAFYPGVIVGDSVASINQAMGISAWSNHYPVIYTLFINGFMKLGELLGSYNIGAFLYTCTQFLLMAVTAGYCGLWLVEKGTPRILVLLTVVFFGGSSVFAVYAITMWKDPLFTAQLLLFSLLLADIGIEKGSNLNTIKQIVQLALISLFVIFWRNNGIYLVCAAMILLAIVYRKRFLRAGIGMLLVIFVSMTVQGPIYDRLGIEKDTVSESLAIPLQQVASVVAEDVELTPEQQNVLFQILPEEDWKASYKPTIADPLKFHANFDQHYLAQHVGDFLKVWAELLFPHFGTYVESYLMETIGFWQIGIKNSNSYVYYYVYEDNAFDLHRVDWFERLWGVSAEEKLSGVVDFLSTGGVVWLVLLCAVLLWMQKKYALMLGMMPAVLLWATVMIATPIAFSMRYILLLAYGLPVFAILPFMKVKGHIENKEH